MDRPAHTLPQRLALPLLGLALVAAPWLAGRWWSPSPAGDASSSSRDFHAVSPVKTAPPDESAQPELLRATGPARALPPSRATPVVLTGALPYDQSAADGQDSAAGPRLGAPTGTSEADSPALPAPPELPHDTAVEAGDCPNFRVNENGTVPFGAQPREADSPAETASQGEPALDDASQPPRAILLGPQAIPTPDSTPLPLSAPTRRSDQLEKIARQADRQTRHGFDLAQRGAFFAARSEFVAALRLLAQALDAERDTTVHSRGLAAGLIAIREADDFLPDGSRLDADLDLAGIVGSHRTPVLNRVNFRDMPPMHALKCYFTYAQEQLAVSAGREAAGSMALHALGKLHAALARHRGQSIRAGESKAMVFYQAALLAFPDNHLAANDLGVLLAQNGNFAEARGALEHSLSVYRQSAGWHNLAVVYRQLGDGELSRRAEWHAEMARRAEAARAGGNPDSQRLVRWVDPATFAQANNEVPAPPPAAPAGTASPPKNAGQPTPAQRPAVARAPASMAKPPTIGRAPWAGPPSRN